MDKCEMKGKHPNSKFLTSNIYDDNLCQNKAIGYIAPLNGPPKQDEWLTCELHRIYFFGGLMPSNYHASWKFYELKNGCKRWTT